MTKLKELANGNTLFNRNFTDSLVSSQKLAHN